MAKAALSALRASALFGAMSLLGCAHPARELPTDMSDLTPAQRLLPGDTSTPEYAISCTELTTELAQTNDALAHIEAELRRTQAENQSKGAAGVLLFAPILLLMEDKEPTKNRYRWLDERRERLLRITQARKCPT